MTKGPILLYIINIYCKNAMVQNVEHLRDLVVVFTPSVEGQWFDPSLGQVKN